MAGRAAPVLRLHRDRGSACVVLLLLSVRVLVRVRVSGHASGWLLVLAVIAPDLVDAAAAQADRRARTGWRSLPAATPVHAALEGHPARASPDARRASRSSPPTAREVRVAVPAAAQARRPRPTEADAAAAYLAQRAAWERKPSGPAPVYELPPPPTGPRKDVGRVRVGIVILPDQRWSIAGRGAGGGPRSTASTTPGRTTTSAGATWSTGRGSTRCRR